MLKFKYLTSILFVLTIVYNSQAGDNRGTRNSRYKIVQGIHYKRIDTANYWVIDTSGGWAQGRKFRLLSDGTLSPQFNPCKGHKTRDSLVIWQNFKTTQPYRENCPNFDSVFVVP